MTNCKSKNTKNEQQKDLCITSEQLTEQWKKGELPPGWYYIKDENSVIYPAENCLNYNCLSDKGYTAFYYAAETEISEILAPVPSYEEWIGVKQQRDLENKLRHDSDNKNWQLRTENAQLKELLKDCREVIKNVDTYYGNYDSINGYLVINKIDEVLK